jgi:hypothetical protein
MRSSHPARGAAQKEKFRQGFDSNIQFETHSFPNVFFYYFFAFLVRLDVHILRLQICCLQSLPTVQMSYQIDAYVTLPSNKYTEIRKEVRLTKEREEKEEGRNKETTE